MSKNSSQKELSNKKIILIDFDGIDTKIAVVDSKSYKLLEYDIDVASCKSLKGNIYLAQVSRVEPALQAAFVNYGSDKHGFLPFNEIHPNYYQLPVEDKELIYEEQKRELEKRKLGKLKKTNEISDKNILHVLVDQNPKRKNTEAYNRFEKYLHGRPLCDSIANGVMKRDVSLDLKKGYIGLFEFEENDDSDLDQVDNSFVFRQKYRINEVISSGQVMLVQVVKDTKGNKGVPLTTYLALAGQYCVFMPNSNKNICVSRKVVDSSERKKIKDLLSVIDMPDGMGMIVRTSGVNKSLDIIKKDLKNQMQLWEKIRSTTIQSVAPVLIHEDSCPLNRVVRDMCDDDVEAIYVEGDIQDRLKKLSDCFIPHFIDKIYSHHGKTKLFSQYNVQAQIANIYQSRVELPSGGYIVIHPTEALVAIDVNSGRAVREHNIEETALKTNLEAATEIAAQVRLRNLSGIVVIDFIDMKSSKNNHKVEQHIANCLKSDSAKTQVGKINNFGLLSMSRQRTYIGNQEIGSNVCSSCNGSGMILSDILLSSLVLNSLEEFCYVNNECNSVSLKINPGVAEYIINNQRDKLSYLEKIHNVSINMIFDSTLAYPNFYSILPSIDKSNHITHKPLDKLVRKSSNGKGNNKLPNNDKKQPSSDVKDSIPKDLDCNDTLPSISTESLSNDSNNLVISKKVVQKRRFFRKRKKLEQNQ